MENMHMHQGRDPELLSIARKRASFKYNVFSYLVMNTFLWGIWYFTNDHGSHNKWPWPIFPMLGWGIGLVFHYIGAYVTPKHSLVDKEYEKLIQHKNK